MRFNTELLLSSLVTILLFGSSVARAPGIGERCHSATGEPEDGTVCSNNCKRTHAAWGICESGVCCAA